MNPPYAMIAIEISPEMDADDLATVASICLAHADSAIQPYSSAWDSDPRDLWQIPAAIASWVSFGALADAYGFRARVIQPGIGVLELCEAAADGRRLERQGDQVVILD